MKFSRPAPCFSLSVGQSTKNQRNHLRQQEALSRNNFFARGSGGSCQNGDSRTCDKNPYWRFLRKFIILSFAQLSCVHLSLCAAFVNTRCRLREMPVSKASYRRTPMSFARETIKKTTQKKTKRQANEKGRQSKYT